jgi:hypothetical protein
VCSGFFVEPDGSSLEDGVRLSGHTCMLLPALLPSPLDMRVDVISVQRDSRLDACQVFALRPQVTDCYSSGHVPSCSAGTTGGHQTIDQLKAGDTGPLLSQQQFGDLPKGCRTVCACTASRHAHWAGRTAIALLGALTHLAALALQTPHALLPPLHHDANCSHGIVVHIALCWSRDWWLEGGTTQNNTVARLRCTCFWMVLRGAYGDNQHTILGVIACTWEPTQWMV